MVIKKLNTYKTTLVAIFLASFSSVFVCDFLCDVGIIDIKLDWHQHEALADRGDSQAVHKHEGKAHHGISHLYQQGHQVIETHPDDSHHHDKEHPTNSKSHHQELITTEHHHDGSEHHETNQDDCCEEEVNAMFASLLKHKPNKFELNTDYFQLAVIFFPFWKDIQFSEIQLQPVTYISDLPPPKSWDIRILIQSFLN